MNFAKATLHDFPIIAGIAGPSGSGKTYSALRFATGLAEGKPIAFIDTERGRALHYAAEFDFLHAELEAPFTPDRYGEAITAALKLDPAVIIVDSFSHEWAGDGGVLDMHEAELDRRAGNDWKKREAVKFAAWGPVKASHKALINDVLLRLPCHLIVCLRAEEKIDLVKDPQTGKLEVRPKRTLAGHVGWIPVTGKEIAYELTISLVVTPDNPGVPQPIKLQEQHRSLVFTDVPLDEATGERLAAWAKGSGAATVATPSSSVGEPAPDTSGALPPSPASAESHLAADASPGGAPESLKPTPGQKRKIGVHIASLRDLAGAVTTEELWANLATLRGEDVDKMIARLEGYDPGGVLHFGPLLADLNREEASRLINWFERVEAKVSAGTAA